MLSIWKRLRSQTDCITILAPMEDVTDTVFRQIVQMCGSPDIMYTEFTNVEGVSSEGALKVIHRLLYHNEIEHPIIAQVWGVTPEEYEKACRVIVDLGFDGVDINMGCPVKHVIKQGACSALIENREKAKEIVQACRKALNGRIPLSIKTRIGFRSVDTESWITFVLSELQPDALIVHGRTVQDQSKVPVRWDELKKIPVIYQALTQSRIDAYLKLSRNEKLAVICEEL